jgi:hypothetical protein
MRSLGGAALIWILTGSAGLAALFLLVQACT